MELDGHTSRVALEQGEYAPLAFGKALMLGGATVRFEALDEELQKAI